MWEGFDFAKLLPIHFEVIQFILKKSDIEAVVVQHCFRIGKQEASA